MLPRRHLGARGVLRAACARRLRVLPSLIQGEQTTVSSSTVFVRWTLLALMHGVLTRDGFHAPAVPVKAGEADHAPQPTKSTEVSSVRVLGESMTGQLVEYETYQGILLHQPLPAHIVDFWTRTIVWYQIVGGEVSRKKLADRREQMQNRKAHLLRLAPTGNALPPVHPYCLFLLSAHTYVRAPTHPWGLVLFSRALSWYTPSYSSAVRHTCIFSPRLSVQMVYVSRWSTWSAPTRFSSRKSPSAKLGSLPGQVSSRAL